MDRPVARTSCSYEYAMFSEKYHSPQRNQNDTGYVIDLYLQKAIQSSFDDHYIDEDEEKNYELENDNIVRSEARCYYPPPDHPSLNNKKKRGRREKTYTEMINQYSVPPGSGYGDKKSYKYLTETDFTQLEGIFKSAPLSVNKKQISERYGISSSSINRFIRDVQKHGVINPRTRGKSLTQSQPSQIKQIQRQVAKIIKRNKLLSPKQIQQLINKAFNKQIAYTDICKVIDEVKNRLYNH